MPFTRVNVAVGLPQHFKIDGPFEWPVDILAGKGQCHFGFRKTAIRPIFCESISKIYDDNTLKIQFGKTSAK